MNDDVVEDLKRSKKLVGELHPVVIDDRTGQVLSGAHRKKAGWTKIEHITTKTDSEAIRLIAAYNAQRGLTETEKVDLFRMMAEALAQEGKTNAEIIHALRFDFIHYHPNYAYTYIPKSYLSGEGSPRGQSLREPETQTFPEGARPRNDSDTGESVRVGECWNCHVKGKITLTGLERLDVTFTDTTQTTTTA